MEALYQTTGGIILLAMIRIWCWVWFIERIEDDDLGQILRDDNTLFGIRLSWEGYNILRCVYMILFLLYIFQSLLQYHTYQSKDTLLHCDLTSLERFSLVQLSTPQPQSQLQPMVFTHHLTTTHHYIPHRPKHFQNHLPAPA